MTTGCHLRHKAQGGNSAGTASARRGYLRLGPARLWLPRSGVTRRRPGSQGADAFLGVKAPRAQVPPGSRGVRARPCGTGGWCYGPRLITCFRSAIGTAFTGVPSGRCRVMASGSRPSLDAGSHRGASLFLPADAFRLVKFSPPDGVMTPRTALVNVRSKPPASPGRSMMILGGRRSRQATRSSDAHSSVHTPACLSLTGTDASRRRYAARIDGLLLPAAIRVLDDP